ncbi:MAG: ABC transporter substrate-binding protein [Gammaproteobacteria bacterium]|nr:ABC transporter substrate-binding protein [Gammaproteobacteria bacterium]MBU1777717.1 ABC transporter substrate-binding protein [Gammaproteobacteria bacterium]MBU1969262.1 ABC transporter substrate-binding protein [Gammaproteobacteria bacterium]
MFESATVHTRRYAQLALSAVAVGLLLLAACSPQKTLTVALHPWVGYEGLYLARDLKWLPDTIQLRDVQTLDESIAALRSGEADAACMTLDEMLRARADGIPLSAALVFDVSAGADAVLVRPQIRRLSDLARKRIGYDRNALGALVFEKLLEAAKLSASDVIQVDLPPARQLEAWKRGEVDAVITYEPMVTEFLREGAHSLFDSRQMPDTIIDVLAVRRDRPEMVALLRTLVATHFRALEHMHISEQDALFRISAREGVSVPEARRMLAGVTLPSLAANRAYLGGDEARLLHAAKTLSALMFKRGLLPRQDDMNELLMPGILPGEGG